MNNGGCSVTCENTVGSFKCSCITGLELDDDGVSCKGQMSLSAAEISNRT